MPKHSLHACADMYISIVKSGQFVSYLYRYYRMQEHDQVNLNLMGLYMDIGYIAA